MRSLGLCLLLSCILAPSMQAMEPECLAALWEPAAVVREGDRTILYYGDEGGRLHRLDDARGPLRETKQVGVPSSVRAIGAADLDGKGTVEVVIATSDGQLSIYEGESLGALWRSSDENYTVVSALTVANVDQDPPLEILLLADGHLMIYDGSTHFKEWTSPEPTTATDLVVTDADGDGEQEIILSSGIVLSTVYFQTEWDAGEPFGTQLLLMDVEGDSIPELLARTESGGIKIFSVKDRQEIW